MKGFSSIAFVATLASSVVASPIQSVANTNGIANTTTVPVETDTLLLDRRDDYDLCKPGGKFFLLCAKLLVLNLNIISGRAYTEKEFDNAYNEGKSREVNGNKLKAKGGDRRTLILTSQILNRGRSLTDGTLQANTPATLETRLVVHKAMG